VSRQELDKAEGEVAVLRSEIVAARAGVASARIRVKLAAYDLEQRLVRAPSDGQIVRKQAKPGDGISTLNVTSLFLFAPESPRIIRADLEERFVSAVAPGMSAEISPQGNESRIIRGKVLRIGRVFGKRSVSTDDAADKQDVRTVECVLSVEHQQFLIGQRVLVRILPQ
jgi:HlyD family secretion protein